MAGHLSGDFYVFRKFRLDCDGGGLFRFDQAGAEVWVPLGSRALQLLIVLIERSGQIVSRDEIFEGVWPGVAVEESNLTVQISALRRALAEDHALRSCIQTIPRRGYRFVAAVRRVEAVNAQECSSVRNNGIGDAPSKQVSLHPFSYGRTGGSITSDKPSIAVLPFVNRAGGADLNTFADDLAEEINTALSRFSSPRVNVHNSSFGCRGPRDQVGIDPEVRYLVEGGLRRAGDHIRVKCRLVNVDTGHCIWSDRFDHPLSEVFAIQDEIAEAVTTSITPIITQAEQQHAMRTPDGNLTAWAACQRGLFYQARNTAADNDLALHFFQQAIHLDPLLPDGYRGMAMAKLDAATQFQKLSFEEVRASAHSLAAQAIELDLTDSESRSALATMLMIGYGDLDGAIIEAERALALTPNLASAHGMIGAALVYSGRPTEGLAALTKSIGLNPHCHSIRSRLTQVISALYFSREYDGAIAAARRALRSYPDHPQAHRWQAAALGQLGRRAEAADALSRSLAIAPASFDMYVCNCVPWMRPPDHIQVVEGLYKAGWRN